MHSNSTAGILRQHLASTAGCAPATAFRRVIGLFAILFSFTVPGFAADELVCTNGALSRALQSAGPGDTVTMCDKTWSDVKIEIDANGTLGKPVTLRAESPGKTILTGSSTIRMAGSYVVVDGLFFKGVHNASSDELENRVIEFRKSSTNVCNNCRLTNVTMKGFSPKNNDIRTRWVTLHGKRNRVDHCYFDGKTNRGAMVQNIRPSEGTRDHNRIDHNYFGNRPSVVENGNELNYTTLEVGTTGSNAYTTANTVVESNYFYKIDSSGEIITVKSSGVTLRNNVIDSSQGKVALRQGDKNVVEGNYIYGRKIAGTGGIAVRGQGHLIINNHISNTTFSGGIKIQPGDAKVDPAVGYYIYPRAIDAVVAFNTLINTADSLVIGNGRGTRPPKNINISNNVIMSNVEPLIYIGLEPVGMTFSSNVMFGAPLGINNRSGIKIVDPRLSADGDGIYRPKASSPLIDAATEVSGISASPKDIDSQVRSLPYDIGADESDSNSVAQSVISKCNVGPSSYSVNNDCVGSLRANAPPKAPSLISVVN